MRKLFLLICFLSSFKTYSQSMTIGSYLNFSVGDIIVSNYYNYLGYTSVPPQYTEYEIYTAKIVSANADSIYYKRTIIKDELPLQNCASCTHTVTSVLDSFYVTNLSASALNFSATGGYTCQSEDITFSQYCGQTQCRKSLRRPGSCGEPPTISRTRIAGVGEYFEYRSNNSMPLGIGYARELCCVNKIGTACMSSLTLPQVTGISVENRELSLEVFPNPVSGKLFINTFCSLKLEIIDLNGRLLLQAFKKQGHSEIDLSEMADGLYLLNLTDESNRTQQRPILIQH